MQPTTTCNLWQSQRIQSRTYPGQQALQGKLKYLICWKGYVIEEDRWRPSEDVKGMRRLLPWRNPKLSQHISALNFSKLPFLPLTNFTDTPDTVPSDWATSQCALGNCCNMWRCSLQGRGVENLADVWELFTSETAAQWCCWQKLSCRVQVAGYKTVDSDSDEPEAVQFGRYFHFRRWRTQWMRWLEGSESLSMSLVCSCISRAREARVMTMLDNKTDDEWDIIRLMMILIEYECSLFRYEHRGQEGRIHSTEQNHVLNTVFHEWHFYCLQVAPCLLLGFPLSVFHHIPPFLSTVIGTTGLGQGHDMCGQWLVLWKWANVATWK